MQISSQKWTHSHLSIESVALLRTMCRLCSNPQWITYQWKQSGQNTEYWSSLIRVSSENRQICRTVCSYSKWNQIEEERVKRILKWSIHYQFGVSQKGCDWQDPIIFRISQIVVFEENRNLFER